MNRGQSFLLLLIAAVSLLTLFIILPFIEYVIAAAILAYVLFPSIVTYRVASATTCRNGSAGCCRRSPSYWPRSSP